MINLSNAAKEALLTTAQSLVIEVEGLDGNLTLEEKDVIEGSFQIDRSSVCSELLDIGNTNSSLLDCRLNNADGRFNPFRFEGAVLRPKLVIPLPDGKVEYLPLGVFTVFEKPRRQATITISAFDRMLQFGADYESSLNYPASLRQIVRECCEKCGVPYQDLSMFPDTADVLHAPISTDVLTYRCVLGWAAQLVGVCAFIDEEGYLSCQWYKKPSTPLVLSDNVLYTLDIEETDTVISGVQFLVHEEGEVQKYPVEADDGYLLQLDGNLLFDALDQNTWRKYAEGLNFKLMGFSYRSFKAAAFSLPYLMPLDMIEIHTQGLVDLTDELGNTITGEDGAPIQVEKELVVNSIITNHIFKLNDKSSLEAKAEARDMLNYAKTPALTARQSAVLSTITKKVDKTILDFSEREQAIVNMNAAAANALGLYYTVNIDESGAAKSYWHDKAKLEESKVIYCFNAGGMFWTNAGWNNGNPVWESGVDKRGNAVLNVLSAYGINADWIKTGLLQSQNGAASWNLNNGNFKTTSEMICGADTSYQTRIYKGYIELYYKNKHTGNITTGYGIGESGVTENSLTISVDDTNDHVEIGESSNGKMWPYYSFNTSKSWIFKNKAWRHIFFDNVNFRGVLYTNDAKCLEYDKRDKIITVGSAGNTLDLKGSTIVANGTIVGRNITLSQSLNFETSEQGVKLFGDYCLRYYNSSCCVGLSATYLRLYGSIVFLGASGTVVTSDRRLKKDIANVENQYEKLFENLKPKTFKYIEGTSGRTHLGFVAQEVENAIEKAGLTTQDFAGFVEYEGEHDGMEKEYGLRYDEFVALNTRMIQKCLKRIEDQQKELEEQQSKINSLEERLAKLETLIK